MKHGDLIGGLIAFVAALLSNFGTNTQKKAHLNEEKLPQSERKSYMMRPLWWLGFLSTVAASIGDFAALGIADQAVVASVGGGSTLVANIFVAHFWHGDAVHLTDVCGVVCVIAGAALFAISSSNSTEDEVEAKDLPHHFTAPWFLTYLSVQGTTMLFLLAGIGGSIVNRWRKNWTFRFMAPVMEEIHLLRRRTEKLEQTVRLLSRKLEPAAIAGIELSSQFSSTRSSMKTFEKNPYGERHWSDKYIYAACAGTVGGLSVLLGGIVAKTFGGGWDLVWTPWFFAFLLGLIITLVLQTHFQNRAMQMGENMAIFPVFQAFWITFGVVSGLYFYNTDTDWGVRFWKASGIAPMILGIAFLFQHQKREKIWRTQSMALNRAQLEQLGIRQAPLIRGGSYYAAVDNDNDDDDDDDNDKIHVHVRDSGDDERKHDDDDDEGSSVVVLSSSSNGTIRM